MPKNKARPERDVDREYLKKKNQEKKRTKNIRKRRNLKDQIKSGK